MSQPVAADSTARSTPLCGHRDPCLVCGGACGQETHDAVAYLARTLAARRPEIQAGGLVPRERFAVTLTQRSRGRIPPIRPSPSRSAPARTAARRRKGSRPSRPRGESGLDRHGISAGGMPAGPLGATPGEDLGAAARARAEHRAGPACGPASFQAVLPWRRSPTIIARRGDRLRSGNVLRRHAAKHRIEPCCSRGKAVPRSRIGRQPRAPSVRALSVVGQEPPHGGGKRLRVAQRGRGVPCVRPPRPRATPTPSPATTGTPHACASMQRHAEGLVDGRPHEEIAARAARRPRCDASWKPTSRMRPRPKRANAASTSGRAWPVADDDELPVGGAHSRQRRRPAADTTRASRLDASSPR